MADEGPLALAVARGFDPGSLRRLPQPELELDATHGGHAFEDAQGHILIVGYDGSFGTFALYDARPTAADVVRQWLVDRRRANRPLTLSELGVWQQAAVVAAREGVTVAELDLGLDEADTEYAESILIQLLRFGTEPLRALAARDHLLAPPEDRRRYTHPCPLCGTPALHVVRHPRSVCDGCSSRTTDSSGRPVTGADLGPHGGFVAHFAGTSEICAEVTARKTCWVDGHACSIDRATSGGVVVEVARNG